MAQPGLAVRPVECPLLKIADTAERLGVEAIFDVYAFAERQRIAEDQNPVSGVRIFCAMSRWPF